MIFRNFRALLFGLGFGMAAALFAALPQNAPDTLRYLAEAENLATALFFSIDGVTPDCFDAPLYAVLLAVLRGIFDNFELAAGLANAVMHGLIAILAYRLAQRIFTPARAPEAVEKIARLAGLLTVFHPGLLGQSAFILSETLYTLLIVAALNLLVDFLKRPNARQIVLCGAAFAFATLTRPIPLLFPFLLFGGALATQKNIGRTFLVLTVFASIVSVWTARNAIRFGSLIPVCLTRHTLWAGSQTADDGEWNEYAIGARLAELDHLNVVEADRALVREAVGNYLRDPLGGARLVLRRAGRYIFGIPGDKKVIHNYPNGRRLYLFWHAGMLALFGTGLWRLFRERPPLLGPVLLYVLYEAVTLSLIFVMPRFHLPMMPVVAVTAAFAVFGGKLRASGGRRPA